MFNPYEDKNTILKLLWAMAAVLALWAVWLACTGCSVFSSGSESASKLATDLENTQKKVDEIEQSFDNVNGNISMLKSDIQHNQSEINTVSQQVTQTTHTPFWQIITPILAFILLCRFIDARASKKKGWKHFLGLRDR